MVVSLGAVVIVMAVAFVLVWRRRQGASGARFTDLLTNAGKPGQCCCIAHNYSKIGYQRMHILRGRVGCSYHVDFTYIAGWNGPKLHKSDVLSLTLYVPIIAILDIWKTTLFYEGESVVYDGFKFVWPVKG